ncbi:MAG: type II toxin-antitoxin system VapC family toxin [Chloroflexota bacterium]|nr:type II toxin-antitoxin system VapC family toxin [Chloroflexota bacterium]
MSVTEVLAGMCQGEEVKTRALLNLFVRWPISEEIAKMAGDYLNQFARSHYLDLGDALIAATARYLNVELITRNVKHYPMPDISVRVPYQRGTM